MNRGQKCHRHRNAAASFVCDRCRQPFCAECRCELLGGGVCCTECAVEMAGANGGEYDANCREALPEVTAPSTGGKRKHRLLATVLLVCLPLILVEVFFLQRSGTVDRDPAMAERRVMGRALVLITLLNRCREETGAYPAELAELVPAYWSRQDMAELGRYEYRRIGRERFTLRPLLSGEPARDAGVVRVLAMIPRSLGPDSDLDVFLRIEGRGGQR